MYKEDRFWFQNKIQDFETNARGQVDKPSAPQTDRSLGPP
jgi:hypothetical protein